MILYYVKCLSGSIWTSFEIFDKLKEFKISLNNKFQDLNDLLKVKEITVENNWEGIKEALS